MTIRVAVGQFKEPTKEAMRFAARLGASGIHLNNPLLPGEERWEARDVRQPVEPAGQAGLVIEAIESVPVHFYDKVMLGEPGRDAQIGNYIATRRAVVCIGTSHNLAYFPDNDDYVTTVCNVSIVSNV